MLSHLGDLSQARKATGHFPLLSRPLSRSCHRSSRFQSSKHNFPTHEQKWKILEKPFRAPIQRERASTKRKVALKVAYTGSGYYGSQKLAENLPTIEGALEQALYDSGKILDTNFGHLEKIGWSRSSRTDKGVHSLATVFGVRLEGIWTRVSKGDGHYEYDIEDDCAVLPASINKQLPEEIRVLAAAPVVQHFDARKSCIHRHYEYLIPIEALENSAYFTDRPAFVRMLNMFVGRHHWHNFGQIDKKQRPFARPHKRTGDQDISDDQQTISTDNVIETPTASPTPVVSEAPPDEPSLLSIAPKSSKGTSERPSLYALDDYKVELQKQQLAKPQRRASSSSVHIPQFQDAVLTHGHAKSESLEFTTMEGNVRNLTPKDIAAMPLDAHLAQDAFFRTISAISHDELDTQGSRYVRVSMQGDSFLLHQVRRMIGALILAARGLFSEDTLRAAIDSPFRIITPRAPPQGLLLRDARFLDVDFKGRDIAPAQAFARDHIYPHMHQKWISMDMAGAEGEINEEVFNSPASSSDPKQLDVKASYNPWEELSSMTPISDVREIIPGYDDWLSWHNQSTADREIRRERRRSFFDEKRAKSKTNYRVTTRESF